MVKPEPLPEPEPEPEEYAYETYVDDIVKRYRPRLSGLISSSETGKVFAQVQFLDDSFHVKEKLTLIQLSELGWDHVVKTYGVLLTKRTNEKDKEEYRDIVITSWPLDSQGRVSNAVRSDLGGTNIPTVANTQFNY